MSKDRIKYLLEQYLDGALSADDHEELLGLFDEPSESEGVQSILREMITTTKTPEWNGKRLDEMVQRVLDADRGDNADQPADPTIRSISLWRRIAVAASVLLVLGLGGYFLWVNLGNQPAPITEQPANDVQAPANTRAMITLANGDVVYLDSVGSGQLATQSNVAVTKTTDGQIIYRATTSERFELVYNTLSNPRGSKVIDMTLADGSRVWLNAGSSVTYPVAFTGNDRQVSITGEAYFEIARDAGKPFYVSKGDVQVRVLGTHFNVNAYDDDTDIKVTLLEGSVEVNNRRSAIKIVPGEQAVSLQNGNLSVQQDVDLEQVMAWKNGIFKFAGSDIESVMKQVSRWYDVAIAYKGEKPVANFRGTISRQNSLSEVLKMLELTKAVRFKVEGKKVIVSR